MKKTIEIKKSRMKKLIGKVKESLPNIIGMFIGAIGGFILYKFVGCSSGNCSIMSSPWLSIIFGTILGYILGSMFNIKGK